MFNQQLPADEAEFIALFEEWSEKSEFAEGDIVEGKVLSIGKDYVIIDIGYKSEGQIAVGEFIEHDGSISIKPGDQVEVYVEARENDMGLVELSKEKADRLKIWD